MNNNNTPATLKGIVESLGPDCLERIQKCRLLVVGAGGIGCELLKNLSLTGFRHIEVVDLDTIDVSNLNRQLLFRAQHVGQPKCVVGARVAQDLSPYYCNDNDEEEEETHMIARHGNVCDNSVFHVQYMEQFDLVLNALDNVTARRRVNRLCLAANVPMMEAGTTGYLGQVQTIYKGVACYECKTQEPPKVYPICTIRSTPSQPVHTIVWAKELYKLLFGPDVVQSMLYEHDEEEPSTFMKYVVQYRDNQNNSNNSNNELNQQLWKAFFVDEIQKQLNMDRYKAAETTPIVLQWPDTKDENTSNTWNPMSIWSLQECIREFNNALSNNNNMPDTFDKDHEHAMRFVTAASQMRSMNFHIPLQSYHDTKGIAGNIIPAIATTNAIVAGLQLLQVFSLLQSTTTTTKTTTTTTTDNSNSKSKLPPIVGTGQYINCLRQATRNGLYLAASPLEAPNPSCFVCREQVTVHLTMPTQTIHKTTFTQFVQQILKHELGFSEPTVYLDDNDVLIWEEGQDSDETLRNINGPKVLSKLPRGGMQQGTVLTVEDFSQDLQVNLRIVLKEQWDDDDEDDEDAFRYHIMGGEKPVVGTGGDTVGESVANEVVDKGDIDEEDDDDDDVIVEIVKDKESGTVNGKRSMKHNEESTHASPLKKQKKQQQQEEEVIEIE